MVLIDSVAEPDPARARSSARTTLAERGLRGRPRLAALDAVARAHRRDLRPAAWRDELRRISAVTVRHHPDSPRRGLLLFGWLASRLGWEPGSLIAADDGGAGRAHGKRGDIELRARARRDDDRARARGRRRSRRPPACRSRSTAAPAG